MNRTFNKFGWGLFFLLLLYFIFLIRQDIIDYLSLRKENGTAGNSLSQAEKKNAEFVARLGRSQGDDLIEEIARTRLGLIKQGEIAYKVISN